MGVTSISGFQFENSMNFPRLCTFGYALVPDDMNAPQTKSLSGRIGRRLLIPLVAVLSVCLGVIIGPTVLNSSSPCKDLMFQSPESGQPFAEDMAFRFLTRTFAYNRSFGADPGEDNSTNDAWESIVPGGIPRIHSPYFLYKANMKLSSWARISSTRGQFTGLYLICYPPATLSRKSYTLPIITRYS